MQTLKKFNEDKLENLSFVLGGSDDDAPVDYNSLSEAEKATVIFENPPVDEKPPFGKTHYTDGCGQPRTDVIIFWITIKINPKCPGGGV